MIEIMENTDNIIVFMISERDLMVTYQITVVDDLRSNEQKAKDAMLDIDIKKKIYDRIDYIVSKMYKKRISMYSNAHFRYEDGGEDTKDGSKTRE